MNLRGMLYFTNEREENLIDNSVAGLTNAGMAVSKTGKNVIRIECEWNSGKDEFYKILNELPGEVYAGYVIAEEGNERWDWTRDVNGEEWKESPHQEFYLDDPERVLTKKHIDTILYALDLYRRTDILPVEEAQSIREITEILKSA